VVDALSWLEDADEGFGTTVLPYGSWTRGDDDRPRVGVAVGSRVLDVARAAWQLLPSRAPLLDGGTLDPLLAGGPAAWREVRDAVASWFADESAREVVEPLLVPADEVLLHLPFTVADYVDFYSSEHHATNVGRIFRPDGEPLSRNWKHLPIGYHGRAGTVVVSGSEVPRPWGQQRLADGRVVVGPSTRLDVEAEVGFVVGVPSSRGSRVPVAAFAEHVFGVCLVNDWSARDLQAFETVPLGPFLAKSFATSVSPWVVPLAALEHARTAPPERDPAPQDYLDDSAEPSGLDLQLEVRLNGHVISRPPFRTMYWTAPQQLAHLTVNGASVRTGDLFASGTVSGARPDERGCLLELSWNGSEPLRLPDGTTRTFLEDGDEVVISATAPGPDGAVLPLGDVRGRVARSA
jgi:fumarylacetoacetase